jgi:hypothetical protein
VIFESDAGHNRETEKKQDLAGLSVQFIYAVLKILDFVVHSERAANLRFSTHFYSPIARQASPELLSAAKMAIGTTTHSITAREARIAVMQRACNSTNPVWFIGAHFYREERVRLARANTTAL